uniref:putative uncharacterized protein DDB_G0282133 n=1 Tax=Erigeron canadensis TaxID=72917 RepID=UPI001CB99AE6|nr:putative uncharacterized protein DDB_G0282133 [Erigeron canadensis]
MNSNRSGSFDFDLGINSNRSKPLNAQKNNNNNNNNNNSNSYANRNLNQTTSYWQPNKPSWTHQPAAPTQSAGVLNGPTSMVGDITGRSWASSAPSGGSGNIGIANKNPNLFSDLLGSNLGGGKGSGGNVPLKNVGGSGVGVRSAYSMGNMADALPKNGGTGLGGGSSRGFGNYNTSGYGSVNKSQNLGGPSMKSGNVSGGGIGLNKDPFGSLVDFSSKSAAGVKAGNKTSVPKTSGDDLFGGFQNASKGSTQNQTPVQSLGSNVFQSNKSSMGSSMGSQSKIDDFGFGDMQNPPPVQSSGGNDFDVLFPSSSVSAGNPAKGSDSFVNEQFVGAENWSFESDIGGGGGDHVGGTTELEGLPPPPSGVTSSSAKSKGMDNYKAGQYPDAIKWLSWAVVLLEKSGDNAGTMEVLSSRASCYKEVGEYKKAVADCSKVLEQDGKNVSVLVQRALLYESMEKYKLGAEDLRTVMNIDPGNRVARSTIHRLTKLAS